MLYFFEFPVVFFPCGAAFKDEQLSEAGDQLVFILHCRKTDGDTGTWKQMDRFSGNSRSLAFFSHPDLFELCFWFCCESFGQIEAVFSFTS